MRGLQGIVGSCRNALADLKRKLKACGVLETGKGKSDRDLKRVCKRITRSLDPADIGNHRAHIASNEALLNSNIEQVSRYGFMNAKH